MQNIDEEIHYIETQMEKLFNKYGASCYFVCSDDTCETSAARDVYYILKEKLRELHRQKIMEMLDDC